MKTSVIHKSVLPCLVTLSILLCAGCGSDSPSFAFEVDYALSFELPPGQNSVEDTVIPFRNLRSEILSELNSRGLTLDDVRSIQTAVARVDQTGVEGNLGVIQEITLNIYLGPTPLPDFYEAAYSIGLQDREIDQIRLVPSLTNLKEPLGQPEFNMEMVVDWRMISPSPIEGILSISFGVELN